jgi:hypothetical protein
MATISHRRVMTILLQDVFNRLYNDVLPGYSVTAFWNVSGIDDDLPDEGEVKAIQDLYKLLVIPALNARAAYADVDASEEPFEGIFAVPSTAFLVPFVFSGPVWGGQSQSQGFGVALELQRLTVFVQDSGTTGANLSIDLQLDSVSMLTAPVSIPVGSGENVGVVVPSSQIATTAIPASGVVSAHILAAPDDAEGVAVNVWVKQS